MGFKPQVPVGGGHLPLRAVALSTLLFCATFAPPLAPQVSSARLEAAQPIEPELAADSDAAVMSIAPSTGFEAEERQLVDLINASRAEVGAAPLAIDERVMRVARWKAEDMQSRKYSAHSMPGGVCFITTCWEKELYVWDALPVAGVHWGNVAENVWLGPELGEQMAEVSNRVFLGSTSHRSATLEPVFTHVGVGIVPYPWTSGVHVVEVFVRLP